MLAESYTKDLYGALCFVPKVVTEEAVPLRKVK